MFGNFFRSLKELFTGPSIKDTFEEMVLQEVVKTESEKPTTIVLDAPGTIGTAKVVTPKITELPTVEVKEEPIVVKSEPTPVNPQITDAVTQIEIEKPKRARTAKGQLKADDKSTPDVNEAWVGGKAPAKKPVQAKRSRKIKKNK